MVDMYWIRNNSILHLEDAWWPKDKDEGEDLDGDDEDIKEESKKGETGENNDEAQKGD